MGKVFERRHRILQLLSTGSYRTAAEVCRQLELEGESLTERQVKRILNELHDDDQLDARLRDLQVNRGKPPTEYTRPRTGSVAEYDRVEPHQALTLQLAAELLDPLLPASILEPLKVELKMAKSLLMRDLPSLQRFPEKVVVLPRGIGRPAARVHSRTLATVYEALLTERRLNVAYNAARSGKKQLRTHEISPLGLICRFDTLYLVLVRETDDPAKDPDHVMEWPVQRFARADLLDTPIRKPRGFKLKDHVKAPGITGNHHDPRLQELGDSFHVKLRFREATGHYVIERPFSKDQQVEQAADGTFVVTATVPNTRDLLSELFNFADDVEVLAPKALREYIAGKAAAVAKLYAAGPKPGHGATRRRKAAQA